LNWSGQRQAQKTVNTAWQKSVVWVEAVEDIVTAKKRLISLASDGTEGYRFWDSAKQQFIDVMDDCA
jgi:hypothetical protein